MGIYDQIEEKYYEFIEWAAARGLPLGRIAMAIEGRGIPSLPVVLILLAVIIGGAYWAYITLTAPTYVITVYGPNGQPLPYYSVTIDGNTFTTNAEGKILLKSPPVSISVPKVGYKVETVGKNPIAVRLVAEVHRVSLNVVDQDGKTIPSVSAQISGRTSKTITGNPVVFYMSYDKGKGDVVPYDDGTVRVTISADGYVSKTVTITWNEGNVSTNIILKRKAPPKGSLVIRTAPSINGTAVLLKNGVPLQNTETVINEGYGTIMGIPYGTYTLKITILSKDGSEQYDLPENQRTVTISQQVTQVVMHVVVPQPENNAEITVIDTNTGKPLAGAYIYAINGGKRTPLGKTGENGQATIYIKSPVQIIVEAKGYYASGPISIQPGDRRTIQMQPVPNVGNVEVTVELADSAGNVLPVDKANVQLRTLGGDTIAEAETNSDGVALFKNVGVGTYFVVTAKGNLYGSERVQVTKAKTAQVTVDLNSGATLNVTTVFTVNGVKTPQSAELKVVTEGGHVLFAAKTNSEGQATIKVPLYTYVFVTARSIINTVDGKQEIQVSRIVRYDQPGTYTVTIPMELPRLQGVRLDGNYAVNDGNAYVLSGVPGRDYWLSASYAINRGTTNVPIKLGRFLSIEQVITKGTATIGKDGHTATLTLSCTGADKCVGQFILGVSPDTNTVTENNIIIQSTRAELHTGPWEITVGDKNAWAIIENTSPFELGRTNTAKIAFVAMREGNPTGASVSCMAGKTMCEANSPDCMMQNVRVDVAGAKYTTGYVEFNINTHNPTTACTITVTYADGAAVKIPFTLHFRGQLKTQKIAVIPRKAYVVDGVTAEKNVPITYTYAIIGIPPTFHILKYAITDSCSSPSANWTRIDDNALVVKYNELQQGRILCIRSYALGYRDATATSQIIHIKPYPKITVRTAIVPKPQPLGKYMLIYVPEHGKAEFNASCTSPDANISCGLRMSEIKGIKIEVNGNTLTVNVGNTPGGTGINATITPVVYLDGKRVGTLPDIPIHILVLPKWTECVSVIPGAATYVKTSGAVIGSNQIEGVVSRVQKPGCDRYTIDVYLLSDNGRKSLGTLGKSMQVKTTVKTPNIPGVATYISRSVQICCTKGCNRKSCFSESIGTLFYVNKAFTVTATPKISNGQICYDLKSKAGITRLTSTAQGKYYMRLLEDIDLYNFGGTSGLYVVKTDNQIPAESGVLTAVALDSTARIAGKEYPVYVEAPGSFAQIDARTACVMPTNMGFCKMWNARPILRLLGANGATLNKEAEIDANKPKLNDIVAMAGYKLWNKMKYPVTVEVNSDGKAETATLAPNQQEILAKITKAAATPATPPTLKTIIESGTIHRVTIKVACADGNISMVTRRPELVAMGPITKEVPQRVAEEIEKYVKIANQYLYVPESDDPCAQIVANKDVYDVSPEGYAIDMPTLLVVNSPQAAMDTSLSKIGVPVAIPPMHTIHTDIGNAIMPVTPSNYYINQSKTGWYHIDINTDKGIADYGIITYILDRNVIPTLEMLRQNKNVPVNGIEFNTQDLNAPQGLRKYIVRVFRGKKQENYLLLSDIPLQNETNAWIYEWNVDINAMPIKICADDRNVVHIIIGSDAECETNTVPVTLRFRYDNGSILDGMALVITRADKNTSKWTFGPMAFALLNNKAPLPKANCGDSIIDLKNTPAEAAFVLAPSGRVCAYSTPKLGAKTAYWMAWGFKMGASVFGAEGSDGPGTFYLPLKYGTGGAATRLKEFNAVEEYIFAQTNKNISGEQYRAESCTVDDGNRIAIIGYWTENMPSSVEIVADHTCTDGAKITVDGTTYCIPRIQ
ncbi:MAG: carboxypeptidase regulatory-like domain-containing protein [Candidatus Diapherotrites archaeon]|nr:carboxypeptidase regulatory-like domain-containing protein [Candidatus Diapherotrites archaeon]